MRKQTSLYLWPCCTPNPNKVSMPVAMFQPLSWVMMEDVSLLHLKINVFPFIFPKTVFQIITAVFHLFLSFAGSFASVNMSQCSVLCPLSLTFASPSIIATFQLFTVKLLRLPAVAVSTAMLILTSGHWGCSLCQGHLKWHLPKSSVTSILSNPMVNFQFPTYWTSPVFEGYILFEILPYSLFF